MLNTIALGDLRAHPDNSNVMPERLMNKLAAHIDRTHRYPPLIVRPMPGEAGAYQVLDGHHRWRVLEQLGHESAQCVVWDVDDEQALVLLATLNRLEGADDPTRRAAVVQQLHEQWGRSRAELAKLLPDDAQDVGKLLALASEAAPEPAEPMALDDMPIAVHFFLLPSDRDRLEARLGQIGGTREEALMAVVGEG